MVKSNQALLNLEDIMAVLKLINNTGQRDEKNLCFVNTSLQLLYSISEVRDFFQEKVYRKNYKERLPISDEVSRIFKTEGQFRTSAAELRRLVGHYHRRGDICNGNQQDMEEFTRLLLECLEKELQITLDEQSSRFMGKFVGRDMNVKLFIDTPDGACQKGHKPTSDTAIFQTIRLTVPETDKELSLNTMIHNHYSVSVDTIMMKCSDCCQHPSACPQSGMCRLRKAAEKKSILVSPTFLYIHLLRFANHSRKIESTVVPENILVLPNGDKFRLLSIGNHLGSMTTNGHYQALIKWLEANDDRKYQITLRTHINGDNYILLYKKISTRCQFVPTDNWEEVFEEQPIPPGLHIKFDKKTGTKFVRFANHLDNSSKENYFTNDGSQKNEQECQRTKVPIMSQKTNLSPKFSTSQDERQTMKKELETGNVENSKFLGLSPVPINRDTQQPDPDIEKGAVNNELQTQREDMNTESFTEKSAVIIESFTFDNFGIQTSFEMEGNKLLCMGCNKWFERIKGHLNTSLNCQKKVDMKNFVHAIDELKKDKKRARQKAYRESKTEEEKEKDRKVRAETMKRMRESRTAEEREID